jgi:hypothetical protein
MSLGPRPKQVKFTVSLMPQIGDWQWLSRVVERTCPRVMIIAAVRSREAIRAAVWSGELSVTARCHGSGKIRQREGFCLLNHIGIV